MRRLGWLAVVAAALVAQGCTEKDPDYCKDAGLALHYSCAKADAAGRDMAVEKSNAGDASDARDATDASADEAGDAPAEKKPLCTADGAECAATADGGTQLVCDTSGAEPKCVECVASTDCKDSKKPACDKKAHRCVECVGTGTECTFDTSRPACDVAAQTCAECVDDSTCGASKPVCDTAKKSCRPCAADTECKAGPGICVDWDGHCAQASEVVTLGGAGCVQAAPNYCKASDAVAALSPTRPILIVKGPDAVAAIDPPAGAASQVLIVGKSNALVGAGSGDSAGVHLTGATEFWVRDLTVSGGTVGIFADSAKLVHVNRCIVTGNGKGGIKTVTSGFDITNNIVAGNMTGSDEGGVLWAGVRLGDVPAQGGARFENNTVVDNKLVGVSCKSPRDLSTSIVHGNVGADTANCAGTSCCGVGDPDPLLDSSYHLKTGSPCIDKLTATNMSVQTDIDGARRPAGGKLDCGADEFGAP